MTRLVLGLEVISGQGWTGGEIYIRNLIATLATLPESDRPDIRLLGIADPDAQLVQELREQPFVDADPQLRAVPGRFARLARRVARRTLGGLQKLDPLLAGIDVTYPTFGPPIRGATPVYWTPDFQHKHLPHMFSAAEIAARDTAVAALAGRPVTLVLSSAAACADFQKFYPGAVAVPVVWSFVSQPPRGDASDPRPELGLPERYLYLPNQQWAHKNHITAFKAMERLISEGYDLTLVCTGLAEDRRDPEHPARLSRFLVEKGLTGRVRMLGLVPRAKQIAIFRHATLVIQPSLFEGWSTVVEDTKALGRPILASDLPVHREQLTATTSVAPFDFFPTTDDAALAAAIAALWPKLAPGPDPSAERRAGELNSERHRSAARAFMTILHAAVEADRGRSR